MGLPVSCETAFDFIADCRNDETWRDELSGVRLLSGDAGRLGARYSGRVTWQGLQADHVVQVVEADRPRAFSIRTEGPQVRVDVAYHFTGSADGCRVDIDYAMETDGAMGLLEPFAWSMFMGWVNDDLPVLAAHLASMTP